MSGDERGLDLPTLDTGEYVGVPSSEPPCCCPTWAIDASIGNCPRHQYLRDLVPQWPGIVTADSSQDEYLPQWVKGAFAAARSAMALPDGSAPYTFTAELHAGDRVAFQLPDGTIRTELYDDTILAFMKHRGPLPEPTPYVPPKWYTRTYWRVRRYRLNVAVQQWIHDHLDEAHCDC